MSMDGTNGAVTGGGGAVQDSVLDEYLQVPNMTGTNWTLIPSLRHAVQDTLVAS